MIRIVLVLEATVGGTRKHLRCLVETLSAREFDVRIVCAVRRDTDFLEDIERFRRLGHRVFVLPMTRAPHPYRDLQSLWMLRRLLRREACDILHLHSAKAGSLGRLAAWNLPCKVIYTPHAFPFLQRTARPLRASYAWAERMLAARTNLLLAVGEQEGRIAADSRWFPATGICVLPNAIDVSGLCAEVRRQQTIGLPAGAKIVGLLGDLRAQKDPLTFLEAAEIVCRHRPGVHFVLPRWGNLLARVEQFIQHRKLQSRISLVPRMGSYLPFFDRLDLGVLPSLWEGLPYALLEALALGIPVIGSDIPPIAGLLEKVGCDLVFPAGGVHELVRRIEAGLELGDDSRRELAQRSLELVQREHALEPWRVSILQIYRALMEGRTPWATWDHVADPRPTARGTGLLPAPGQGGESEVEPRLDPS